MKKLISLFLCAALICSLSIPSFAAMLSAEKLDFDQIESCSLEKYNTLLKAWSEDPNQPDDKNASFPSFFGGAYINDTKKLVIQVTTYDDAIIEYFSELIDLNNVLFSKVSYSLDDLFNIQETLNERIRFSTNVATEASSGYENIEGTGISITNNTVNLYVSPETDTSLLATNTPITELIVNLENVQIVTLEKNNSSNSQIDLEDSVAKSLASTIVMEPGQTIYIPGLTSGSYYAYGIGFWAEDSSGNPGIVTAGHGPIMSGLNAYDNWGETYFGAVMYPVLFEDDVDGCFIERENSAITPRRYVSGWEFNLTSDSYAILTEGASVFMKAPASGCRMGTVLDSYFNPSSMEGDSVYLEEAVLTSCYAEPGDSGGLVAGAGSSSQRHVVGIVSGGKILPDTNQMYYAKVSRILPALGVTVY